VPNVDPDAAPSAELASGLGVDFVPELLDLALTHRSYSYEHGRIPHNERLEFLGDAVLGQAISAWLYREYPDFTEGELTRLHHVLVSTEALAQVARGLDLGRYLHLGRGEHLTGGIDKDSILADAVEAIFAAAYLSAGHDAAEQLVLRLVTPLRRDIVRLGALMDPKTVLQELANELGHAVPAYAVTGRGPDHDRTFIAVVTVNGADGAERARGRGEGRSKKLAELAAALDAWQQLAGVDLEAEHAAQSEAAAKAVAAADGAEPGVVAHGPASGSARDARA